MTERPIELIGRGYPNAPCEARISIATLGQRRFAERSRETRALGLDVDQCGTRAEYQVEGRDLCERHAGAAALRILLDQAKADQG